MENARMRALLFLRLLVVWLSENHMFVNTVNMTDVEVMSDTKCKEEKFGNCEVCDLRQAKYTCPRCEVKTCSLPCVTIHKKELECSGIRDKTFFKKMSKMGNLDLLSDYRLLEEVTRSVEKYRKDPLKHTSWINKTLPMGMYKIMGAARQRGLRLHYLPGHFTRHKDNTTFLNYKTKRLEWRVEWIFPQAENLCLISERVLETLTLTQAVSPYLDPSQCQDGAVREKLQYYFSAGVQNVCFLLRVGELQKKRFHLLDGSLSLYANLQKKSIIEFPTIYVVPNNHKYSYTIYNSDCENSESEDDENDSSSEDEESVEEEESEDEPMIVDEKPGRNLLVSYDNSSSSSSSEDD